MVFRPGGLLVEDRPVKWRGRGRGDPRQASRQRPFPNTTTDVAGDQEWVIRSRRRDGGQSNSMTFVGGDEIRVQIEHREGAIAACCNDVVARRARGDQIGMAVELRARPGHALLQVPDADRAVSAGIRDAVSAGYEPEIGGRAMTEIGSCDHTQRKALEDHRLAFRGRERQFVLVRTCGPAREFRE
jgi:hypothetical protein